MATRNNGIGHQALAKFCCVMNMPPPMNENSYRDHVAVVRSAAQAVCKQSMPNAEPQEDGNFDIRVSGDGTQRKRGYSSSYGVVTALSTITGKVVHVEVMSKNLRSSIVAIFADDFKLFKIIEKPSDKFSLQQDLTQLSIWSDTWEMCLGLPNCKALNISRKKIPTKREYHLNRSHW